MFVLPDLEQSLFKTNILDNKVLLWSAALQAVASFALVYIPVIVSNGRLCLCASR